MPRERDHQQSDWHSHATDTHAAGTSKSRVEPETVTYLNEVSTHYATLHEDDERQLLLNNVLEEISGKELRIASDAATSRVLEQLLRDAPAQQLVQFMTAFTNEDLLYKLAARYQRNVAARPQLFYLTVASQLDSAGCAAWCCVAVTPQLHVVSTGGT